MATKSLPPRKERF
uniref:Uncharacterized protein n=1 Tax=Anguilla anguilla TaxID=7936 RepID=A0A0E9VET4_ANGAN